MGAGKRWREIGEWGGGGGGGVEEARITGLGEGKTGQTLIVRRPHVVF